MSRRDDDKAARAIKSSIAGTREARRRFLAELVKTPSDNPPGDCAPHAAKAEALLAALGYAVERHVVPEAEVKAAGMIACVNLVIRERFGAGGPTIALNAHGDVVPPGTGWTADPYGAEIRDGVMYGRGVAVSKSDFATYAYALLALKRAAAEGALALKGTVELHFTHDEESGGTIGPQWLLARGISKPDYAISAGFAYGVTTAHNGCLHFEVEVRGKSGHAAEPEKGHDALEAASAMLHDLYSYRKALKALQSKVPGIGSPTMVIGLIEGGINTNVVPDRVVFRLDRRIIPDEIPGAAEKFIVALLKESVAKMPGISVDIRKILEAKPFLPRPGQERLVDALQKGAEAVMGLDIEAHGVPLYTDARHYSEAGVPTVLYGAGPRTLEEANGHRADEKLRLDDLDRATEVVALALADLLGAGR